MMLNKIPLLDHGWIARVSSSNESKTILDIQEMIGNNRLFNNKIPYIASLTLAMRCPLFVQLNLSTQDLDIIPVTMSEDINAYVPNEVDISTTIPIQDRINIRECFQHTTDVIIMNMETLAMDGCDRYIAQTMAPLSTYTELIVHGSLRAWLSYLRQTKLSTPLEDVKNIIEGIILAEWPKINRI